MNEALVLWLMAPDSPEGRLALDDFLNRPAWHQRAVCRGVVGPSDYVRGPKADYEAVRALCVDCPVRQECLEVALADDSLVGLWGGTTELERRALRRARVA
jgi:WhiB family transcriptional regulator, redox-sensing transcriptional regulator